MLQVLKDGEGFELHAAMHDFGDTVESRTDISLVSDRFVLWNVFSSLFVSRNNNKPRYDDAIAAD